MSLSTFHPHWSLICSGYGHWFSYKSHCNIRKPFFRLFSTAFCVYTRLHQFSRIPHSLFTVLTIFLTLFNLKSVNSNFKLNMIFSTLSIGLLLLVPSISAATGRFCSWPVVNTITSQTAVWTDPELVAGVFVGPSSTTGTIAAGYSFTKSETITGSISGTLAMSVSLSLQSHLWGNFEHRTNGRKVQVLEAQVFLPLMVLQPPKARPWPSVLHALPMSSAASLLQRKSFALWGPKRCIFVGAVTSTILLILVHKRHQVNVPLLLGTQRWDSNMVLFW